MNDPKLEKILRQVRAIIELEKSERALGNEAAANNYAQRVANLMESYRITLAQLEPERIGDSVIILQWTPEGTGETFTRPPVWVKKLASAIAMLFHCQTMCFNRKPIIEFVGLTADAHITREMMTILLNAALRFLAEARRTGVKVSKPAYLEGFAYGIVARIEEMKKAKERETGAESANSAALMRLADSAVADTMERILKRDGITRETFNNPTPNADMMRGYADAHTVSLETDQLAPVPPSRGALTAGEVQQ